MKALAAPLMSTKEFGVFLGWFGAMCKRSCILACASWYELRYETLRSEILLTTLSSWSWYRSCGSLCILLTVPDAAQLLWAISIVVIFGKGLRLCSETTQQKK